MRVVFMGTPQFAVPSLRVLAASHDVVAVYTAPDRPAGRGLRLKSSAVKAEAEKMGLRVEQPRSLKDPIEHDRIDGLRPDVVCVAAYGLILPPGILATPPRGCVNIHASLLPRWRGAAPIERAILAGDAVAGVSIMLMEEGLDTGPYAAQSSVQTGGATAVELRETLAVAGARLLIEVLGELADGTVTWTSQDDSQASYAAKITAADVALSPDLSIEQACRRVRASGRTAPSRAQIDGRPVSVELLARTEESLAPGVVARCRDGLRLGFADGALKLVRLRPSGKSSMDGAAFARGAHLGDDARWGAPQ
jgi:methionyl-tRNA formyltransferase